MTDTPKQVTLSLTLKEEPGFFSPKRDENGLIIDIKDIPKELPYGSALIKPTTESIHMLLDMVRYYAMPAKNKGIMHDISSKKEALLPTPLTTDLEEITEWAVMVADNINNTPKNEFANAVDLTIQYTPLDNHNICSIFCGTKSKYSVAFRVDIYSIDGTSIQGMTFNWAWVNPAITNKIYADKIQGILIHDDCVNWKVGDLSYVPEPTNN